MDEICYPFSFSYLYYRNFNICRSCYLEKFFLIFVTGWVLMVGAAPLHEVEESGGEQSDFWPPDMIPHPVVPGDGPSGPGDSDFIERDSDETRCN